MAVYDYALYSEILLGYESHLIFPLKMGDNTSLTKFQSRFNVSLYDDLDKGSCGIGGPELPKLAISVGCNLLYMLKEGKKLFEPLYPSSYNIPLLLQMKRIVVVLISGVNEITGHC